MAAVAYDDDVSIQLDAKADAERIISGFWPRGVFPVDPVRIARGIGIEVVDGRLDGDVAGALVKERDRDAVIVVNGSDSPNRKRFTVAHELGHFVRHRDDEYEYVDHRNAFSGAGVDREEVYANAFAANLLMPEDEVRRLERDGATDYEMALRFGVSREAMNVRLSVLNATAR